MIFSNFSQDQKMLPLLLEFMARFYFGLNLALFYLNFVVVAVFDGK